MFLCFEIWIEIFYIAEFQHIKTYKDPTYYKLVLALQIYRQLIKTTAFKIIHAIKAHYRI